MHFNNELKYSLDLKQNLKMLFSQIADFVFMLTVICRKYYF